MATNYERGRSFEYKCRNAWRKLGYISVRSAGSHSCWDLISIHPDRRDIILSQCKVVTTEAEARRLMQQFKLEPPMKPAFYNQVMQVWVKQTREYLEQWA